MLRVSGFLALALGVVGVVGFVTGFAFGSSLPPVVRYANFAAAIVEGALGAGVLRRRRAPWSFLLALEWTMLVVNLLALPHLIRAGAAGHVAIVFASARAALTVLLTLGSHEVE